MNYLDKWSRVLIQKPHRTPSGRPCHPRGACVGGKHIQCVKCRAAPTHLHLTKWVRLIHIYYYYNSYRDWVRNSDPN